MFDEDRRVGAEFVSFVRGAGDRGRSELRTVDEDLLKILSSLKIDSDPEIIKRLMLLNTRRRALGNIVVGTVQGLDKEGAPVEKKAGTHLDHTLNLINVCGAFASFFPPEWQEKYLLKIKSAAILHDLGKTGPAGATPEEQKTFIRLFSFFEPDYEAGKNFKNLSIQAAIERHAPPEEREEMLASLPGLGLSPEQTMSEVFGRHVDYTYQILKSVPNVDPEVVFLAASHHRGLRNYPYQLGDDELATLLPHDEIRARELDEAATVVELSDVFEALSSRGQLKGNEQVIAEMIRMYTRATKGDPLKLTKELGFLEKMKIAVGREE